MSKKKGQILVLVCIITIILGIMIVFLSCQKGAGLSTDYQESGREDTVSYGGREYRYNDHLSNYLFLGIDKRELSEEEHTRAENGRADAIYLLSYDRVEKTAKGIAIPRDTITNIHTYSLDGSDLGLTEEHINMQYLYGDGRDRSCRLMKEAVSSLMYGIPIQGYLALNMDGIPVAVGTLQRVDVVVPNNSLEIVDSKYKEGMNVIITEENAELFVRYRDTSVAQSAIARMERQKAFMEAFLVTAKRKASNDTGLVANMFESLKPYMVTNMGTDVFVELLDATYDSDNKIQDIPGKKVDGNEFDEYHIDETRLYEFILQNFYEEVQDD